MEHIQLGKLSALTGLSRETLKFYEKSGLIPAPQRNRSGYRIYPEGIQKRIEFILRAKEAGFTLAEISATLALADEKQKLNPQDFMSCIEKKITQVKNRINELQIMASELERIRVAMDEEDCCPLIKEIIEK